MNEKMETTQRKGIEMEAEVSQLQPSSEPSSEIDIRPKVVELNLSDLGTVLSKSNYFKDARDASQAIVKVLAGRELGIGPIASMTGIYIVEGKVTLSAPLIAACIRRSTMYGYRIIKHDGNECEIEFYRPARAAGLMVTKREEEILGRSSFSIADARAARLADKPVWKAYPRNMLFARAMSNGAKWFCPDVFDGPVYTPEEFGAPINETGEVDLNKLESKPVAAVPVDDGTPATDSQVRQLDKLIKQLDLPDDQLPAIGNMTKLQAREQISEWQREVNRRAKEAVKSQSAEKSAGGEPENPPSQKSDDPAPAADPIEGPCWATNDRGEQCILRTAHEEHIFEVKIPDRTSSEGSNPSAAGEAGYIESAEPETPSALGTPETAGESPPGSPATQGQLAK